MNKQLNIVIVLLCALLLVSVLELLLIYSELVRPVQLVRKGAEHVLASNIPSLDASEMILVKCAKCGTSFVMSGRDYYNEVLVKAKANPSMSGPLPLACQECGQDGIVRVQAP